MGSKSHVAQFAAYLGEFDPGTEVFQTAQQSLMIREMHSLIRAGLTVEDAKIAAVAIVDEARLRVEDAAAAGVRTCELLRQAGYAVKEPVGAPHG